MAEPAIIGVDFGTTNSVVAVVQPDGGVRTLGGPGLEAFRTVLCFWMERGALAHAAGPAAVAAYLGDPEDTRLIMSMKTYLAQRSFAGTQVMGRGFTLEGLVGLFLLALLGGVGAGAHIVAGRPVRFAGERADDGLGEARLREGFRQAGLGEVEVALEPEAAGFRFARELGGAATVLIGDFGGGTSDFSVLRFAPGAGVVVLGTAGVGVAGDSFDARIIDRVVAPHLGKGGLYRVMGSEMPVPAEYFTGLSRWHRLSMMRTPRMLREIGEVARTALDPAGLGRLMRVISEELGYQLYQAVSAVKAELSVAERAVLRFRHPGIEIEAEVTRAAFEGWIGPELAALEGAVERVLGVAGVGGVDRVFLTGGTAFVPAVRRLFERRFGAGVVSGGGEFVSVAEGLALIGGERFRAGGRGGPIRGS